MSKRALLFSPYLGLGTTFTGLAKAGEALGGQASAARSANIGRASIFYGLGG